MIKPLPRLACADVLLAAGLGEHHAWFAARWDAASLDGGFLIPAAVRATCDELGMRAENRDLLLNGLALFHRIPQLRVLAAQILLLCCERDDDTARNPGMFPALPATLHPSAGLFYAYIVLGGYADTVAWNAKRGIPPETTRAVFADLERWLDEHQRAYGQPGFNRMGWLWLHLQGRLHQLGRLQFELTTWQAPVRALRHTSGNGTALLMAGEQELRADGRHQGIAGSERDPRGFTTMLSASPQGWRGHRVADGVAEAKPSDWAASEWQAALSPGDPVLFLHIPAGGGLTPEACAASCRAALEFFPRHFPERPFAALVSISWMFDPQLARVLPAESNLVRFQRAFHLHPHADLQGRQIRERVLGHPDADWRTLTPTTSLQRAVIEHLRAGGLWCQHGAVLFPDAVEHSFR